MNMQTMLPIHRPPTPTYGSISRYALQAQLLFEAISEGDAPRHYFLYTDKLVSELELLAKSYYCEVNEKSDNTLFNCMEGKYLIAKALEEKHPGKNPKESLEKLLASTRSRAKELSELFDEVHKLTYHPGCVDIVHYLYDVWK